MKVYEYNLKLNEDRLPILAEKAKYNIDGRRVFCSPAAIAELAGHIIGLESAAEEYAYCIAFDLKQHVLGLFEVGHGGICSSMVDIRGIFQKSLMIGAARVALVYNHPSGDCMPSREDDAVTQKVKTAGQYIGVDLIDHVIIGNRCYYSYQEERRL